MSADAPRISDYAIIGNGRSAALVSRYGSIDWLCWPQFDSASLFAAILDRGRGGSWSIAPAGDAEIERRYLENTNVLKTRFRTASGVVTLTDCMAVAAERAKRAMLWPEHELIRLVRCDEGEVDLRLHFNPRPDYGRSDLRFAKFGALGWRADVGLNLLTLLSDVDNPFSGSLILRRGETRAFSLTFSTEGPGVIAPLGEPLNDRLRLTIDWWKSWAAQTSYGGDYKDAVIRSALVLKLLSFAPSGAIIAAPTTSLPERAGAELNWDYRFAWLRDAAFTVRALFGLGYKDDAEAFVNWLLHATRLTRPELRVLYDVYGEHPPPERLLDHLRGYADSRPVRIGNAAREQFQLDAYGEVIDAVAHFAGENGALDRETQKMLRQCGDFVCQHWRDPDDGMWEYRDERRRYTNSLLMCWVALDRLLQMHRRGQLRIDARHVERTRAEIGRELQEYGWNEQVGAYIGFLGGEALDTNVLRLAMLGFEDPGSKRMRQTHERIREKLSPRRALLYRNERSIEWREGAFALCSFWEVDFLARGAGSLEQARKLFESALSYANDVGLFGEEIEVESGEALGNFPQAFTHVGVINAAISIQNRKENA